MKEITKDIIFMIYGFFGAFALFIILQYNISALFSKILFQLGLFSIPILLFINGFVIKWRKYHDKERKI